MDYLLINNMQFFAYHGVYEQENKVGNNYSVDLKLGLNFEKACISDSLEDTVNYASIFDKVKTVMHIPCKLVEHLAENICQELKAAFPEIQSIEIKVTKKNPPIPGEIESISIILSR